MPSEYNTLVLIPEQPLQEQQQQIKLCLNCHKPLIESALVYPDNVQFSVCSGCQFLSRGPLPTPQFCIDVGNDSSRLPEPLSTTRRDRSFDTDTQDSERQYHGVQITPSSYVSAHTQFAAKNATSAIIHHTTSHNPRSLSAASSPLTDITRLRVRSQPHHCLYPGSTFQGTQKSGRNSYDVTVTIVVRTAFLSHIQLPKSCGIRMWISLLPFCADTCVFED